MWSRSESFSYTFFCKIIQKKFKFLVSLTIFFLQKLYGYTPRVFFFFTK